jgi:hypothetical protein
MDTELVIAIAVGSGGAVLGFLGLIAALLTRISVGRLGRDVQALEHAAAQAANSAWMKDRELEGVLKRRRLVIRTIQKLKDELEPLLNPPESGADHKTAIQAVTIAGKGLFTMVQEMQPRLGKSEQAALNRAREAALAIGSRLRGLGEPAAGPLPDRERQALFMLRTELSEVQQVVRETSLERLIQRVLDRAEGAADQAPEEPSPAPQ